MKKISISEKIKRKVKSYDMSKIVVVLLICLLVFSVIYDRLKGDINYRETISRFYIEENRVDETVLYITPVKNLNPIKNSSEEMYYLNRLIYSSLFRFDSNMTPEGDLVESYEFTKTEGNTTVKLTLKSAEWQNGGQVTAEDIKFTVNEIKKLGDDSMYAGLVDKIENVTGQESIVYVTFSDSKDVSLAYLTFPIINSRTYSEEKYVPDSSGTYHIDKYNLTKEIILEPNNRYYGTRADSSVKVRVQKESSNFIRMVETSNLSLYMEKSIDRKTQITKKEIEIVDIPSNMLEFTGFNMKNGPMSDKPLREALMKSLDIDKIVEENYYKNVLKSNSMYLPNVFGTANTDQISQDIASAEALLRDAGYRDTDSDGFLEKEEGENISVKILVRSDSTERVDTAEDIEQSLKGLHIGADVILADENEYLNLLKKGDFDIFVGGYTVSEALDFRSLISSDGKDNFTGYSNDKINNLLDEFMSGVTVDRAAEIIVEINDIVADDIPYIPIGYRTYGVVRAPVLDGDIHPNYLDPYRGIGNCVSVYEKRIPIDSGDSEEATDE